MLVSINPEPNKEVFQSLLKNTVDSLKLDSLKNQKKYQDLLGSKLESVVADVMTEQAIDTPFEGSIVLIGGQRFPDIIANNYYGVEVKTSKQNHWTTTGNSVFEGTRVDGIERIYMLFGKMYSPIDFKCRPYEECLSEVVVTHSPRYLVNMDLEPGETIFDKLKIPYDTLRKTSNPIRPIIDYYKQFLKSGEELWWMDQDESKSTGLIIKSWNNLPLSQRNYFVTLAFVFFPEVFSNSQDKFNGVATWLINSHGVICPNMRDAFTAGGQGRIVWNEKTYSGIPKVIIRMVTFLGEINRILNNTKSDTLQNFWGIKVTSSIENWIDLVTENTKNMRLPLDLKEYLKENIKLH